MPATKKGAARASGCRYSRCHRNPRASRTPTHALSQARTLEQSEIGSSAMIIRIPDSLYQQTKAAEQAAGRPQYRVGRRGFVGSALLAATLPLGRAWADANDVELPEQLSAVGLDGKPISIARADIKDFRASLHGQLLLAGNDGYEQARKIWN